MVRTVTTTLYTRGMRNIGAALVIAAYLVLLFTSSVGVAYMSDAGIGLTQARWHFDPMMVAIAIAGIMLALIPARRGERWAQVTQVAMLASVLTTRFVHGAKRLVVLDSSPQGHSVLIIVFVLAIAGLVVSQPSNPRAKSFDTAGTSAGRV
jgi:hypothetical protein